MALHQYTQSARKRIAKAVLWTETQSIGQMPTRQRPTAYPMAKIVRAQADIEHGQIGDVKHLEAPALDQSFALVSGDTAFKVYNPGHKVWSGADLIISQIALPGEDESNQTRWFIAQAWSARRIRGTATAQITPGGTGTLTITERLDGHYGPATVSVYLPTAFVAIAINIVTWVELVYRASFGTSRWEVYSADCEDAA